MGEITTVILAAGKSKRYKGPTTKLMQDLAGLPVISHVYNTFKKISKKNIIIVCNKKNINKFKNIFNDCKLVIQEKQEGTAHAILSAKPFLKNKNFLITFGDAPLISIKSIKKLIKNFKKNNSTASMIAFNTLDSYGYGRVINNKNKVVKVIEEINTTIEEKKINLCNGGVMLVKSRIFFENLNKIKLNKLKKERYLPDIFEIYNKQNQSFNYIISKEEEMLGINTLEDFKKVDKIYQTILQEKLVKKGVLINNPSTCYLSYDTSIEKGVIIETNVVIKTKVKISKGTIIKSHSYIEGVDIKKNSTIGPFARIRPNSKIGNEVKIGNYVEIKNSTIEDFTSIAHLSYIGDSHIGKKVNIGAGTITCNYDGKKKHKTIIKNGAFIGSNTSIIAPVIIHKEAKIAAGSVINADIPAKNIAIERSKLKIIKKK